MIWIPLESNQRVNNIVVESLGDGYRLVSSPWKEGLGKSANIWKNRAVIFKKFLEGDGKYLRMQDSNIMHLTKNNFPDMERFLDGNPEHGFVALFPKPGKPNKRVGIGHIWTKCVVIRRSCLEQMPLKPGARECNCNTIQREIRDLGFVGGYLEQFNRRIKWI